MAAAGEEEAKRRRCSTWVVNRAITNGSVFFLFFSFFELFEIFEMNKYDFCLLVFLNPISKFSGFCDIMLVCYWEREREKKGGETLLVVRGHSRYRCSFCCSCFCVFVLACPQNRTVVGIDEYW